MVDEAADLAAARAISSLLFPLATHLDNSICQKASPLKSEEKYMSTRVHQRITLPNGEQTWCNGKSLSEAIGNLLAKITLTQAQNVKNAPTMKEYAEHWYNTYHIKKVKHNTALNTRTYLDKYIYPVLAEKKLNEITFDDVQQVFTNMENKSASTADKIKVTLNMIFANAKEDKYVVNNVMESSRYVLPSRRTKRKALTRSSINDIINNLSRLQGNDKLLLALAIYTGMRRGEVLALRWEQINFDVNLIFVKNSITFINNKPTVTSTKSEAGVRQIPLDPALKKILEENRQKAGYIIQNGSDPETPITEKMFQRMFQRISKTIDLHGATMHVFRHTYATLRKPQCDIKTLQHIMGHSDIKVTMNTYVDSIDEDIQKLSKISMFCAPSVHEETPETVVP